MRAAELIIKRPLLTEKGSRLKETGGSSDEGLTQDQIKSKVLFEVVKDANKIEIRHAVQKLWNVEVLSVHTQIMPSREKRVGRFVGRRSPWKKAIVTLAPGQSIEFFEGV
ncbi:MAG: 50S ribosomal protein L23 [Myxococcales bacterium]|nr:50S ribosomal protein L23 [Myxococcales bacterium]